MVGEQVLSCVDYALAVGLHSADATGMEAADTSNRTCEAIQVGLHSIDHAAGFALKVHANLELARQDKALSSLAFHANTKAQLRTLPFDPDELGQVGRGL